MECLPLMNNLTAEEMGNMTLGELKEMQQPAWNNTTACPAKEPGRNCSQWGRNANESLGMKGKGMGEMGMGDNQMRDGPMDGMSGRMAVQCAARMTIAVGATKPPGHERSLSNYAAYR